MNDEQKTEMGNPRKDGALKQAARWVAKMFGYKAESKLGRFVWRVFATSAAIVALLVAIALVINIYNHIHLPSILTERYRIGKSAFPAGA